ncbi:helix-turn-helix domain-containing protein [Phocaeicola coprocola]|uniref:helix-turn-helix domain-containing protein n=1 Tax=Phocaeicola coprocola TaxID=310298 RepID=UPI003977EC5A
MDAKEQEMRLTRFERDLTAGKDICCLEGEVKAFPKILCKPFLMNYVGLIVCEKGYFCFDVDKKKFTARAGETVFLSEGNNFSIGELSDDLRVSMLFYHVDPIREILGSSIVAMYLYTTLTPEPCYVWTSGEESDLARYIALLGRHRKSAQNPFDNHECKLLLLALTYRLCSIYSRRIIEEKNVAGHKIDTFIKLIRLIEKYYMQERGVAFYADKLCLSPKYLSALSKSVCGYTVQELVFRAIIRKSIFWLKNTNKSVQEISDDLNFPNASFFGTFFKKQTGLAPSHYRISAEE